MTSMRVGEALIKLLEQRGVDILFGIPGIHTIELYRGLANSPIRHITPRHEQGAAFMADGYARVTGKPGVCLLITGPGLTNAITAIAQARADSVPMLIISGVNARDSLGKQQGHLHELPDQAALSRTVCLETFTLLEPDQLGEVVDAAFAAMTRARPGPVHIEIPTDVMPMEVDFSDTDAVGGVASAKAATRPEPSEADIDRAAAICNAAKAPLILAGGGTVGAASALQRLATMLDAPVISTVNARGVMAGHPLNVPASPTLKSIRALVASSDLVLAIGTEIGPTDYDMFDREALPDQANMIRVDIAPEQFAKRADRGLMVPADARAFASAWADRLSPAERQGALRAKRAYEAALEEIGPTYRAHVALLHDIWQRLPEAIIVGDSTQLVYAGNMLIDPPEPGVWFNSATGFGTLGYAAPAAIGASLGEPGRPVVCLIGDGGLQFTLAELGCAAETGAEVIFLVWNNRGYQEIETAMIEAGVTPLGVKPRAADFTKIAEAYGLAARHITDIGELPAAVGTSTTPCLIEYTGRGQDA